jgi:hypothetical protein
VCAVIGAALLAVGGCDAREDALPPQAPIVEADAGDAGSGVPEGCTACGATACCGDNISCEPVDFAPACVCGAEPACTGEDVCYPWEDGVLRCTVLVEHGGEDCTTLPRRCADGTLCISYEKHGGQSTRCHTTCSVSSVLCAGGAYCIGLLGKQDDGVCNAGGSAALGASCTTHGQCKPDLFCVDGRCAYPCRRSAPKCPSGLSCLPLEGESHAGVCF